MMNCCKIGKNGLKKHDQTETKRIGGDTAESKAARIPLVGWLHAQEIDACIPACEERRDETSASVHEPGKKGSNFTWR